jgi:hypothetical protein
MDSRGYEMGAGHGLLLVHGRPDAVATWARRGVVATHLTPLDDGWTGVSLAEDRARSAAPYDIGLEMLSARSVPGRSRPAIGFFVMKGRAVISAQPKGLRQQLRWLVWEPGHGIRRTPDLPLLAPDVLIASAGARTRPGAIISTARNPSGRPIEMLVEVIRLLGLPGEALLVGGPAPQDRVVEPSRRSVRAFDALVAEDAAYRTEPGGGAR